MAQFDIKDAVLKKCLLKEDETVITVPDGVTTIGRPLRLTERYCRYAPGKSESHKRRRILRLFIADFCHVAGQC